MNNGLVKRIRDGSIVITECPEFEGHYALFNKNVNFYIAIGFVSVLDMFRLYKNMR